MAHWTTAKNGKSSVFTTVPESDNQFTITGKWDTNTSAFTQDCTIAYSDGSSQSIEYNKKGLIQGDIELIFQIALIRLSQLHPENRIKLYALFHPLMN